MKTRTLVCNAPVDPVTARYGSLCQLAQRALRHERSTSQFQPTEIAHEAYWRIVASDLPSNLSHAQFCKVSSRVINNILVDEARKRKTQKRGANVQVLQFDEARFPSADKNPEELLALHQDRTALHDVLDRLRRIDPRKRQIVDLLFFEESTLEEAAVKLGLSVSTVKTHWNLAKEWLRGHIEHSGIPLVVNGSDQKRRGQPSPSQVMTAPGSSNTLVETAGA